MAAISRAEHTGWQIMAAAQGRLEKITRAEGYWYDVRQVLLVDTPPDELNDLPVLLLAVSEEENEKIYQELGDGGGEGPGALIEASLGLAIAGLVKGDDAIPLVQAQWRLIRDIETALTHADLHLGLSPDTVRDIRCTGRFAEPPGAVPQRGDRGVVEVLFRVNYDYLRGAP